MSVKKITKQEKILCNACYEAGQSSAVSEIRELEKKLALAEGEVIQRGENFNRVKDKLEIAKEALEKCKDIKQIDGNGNEYEGQAFYVANKALKQLSE